MDSVIYYFIELVNEEKFRIGPVFDGVIEEVYEKKFYQKNGKWVNDTARMSYATPQKLVIDSGLTLGAEHQAEYLRLYNELHNEKMYVSHYQKEGEVDNYDIISNSAERAEYFKTPYYAEIVTGVVGLNIHPKNKSVNRIIAEEAFGNFYRSKGHKKIMLGVKRNSIGVSVKTLGNGDYRSFVFLCTLI